MAERRPRRGFLGGGVAALALALIAGCSPGASPAASSGTAAAGGTTAASPAAPLARPVVRFVVGSDGHWGQAGTDWVTYHRDFVAAVTAINAATPLSFVVLNGDLTNQDVDLLPAVKDALAGLPVPLLATRGNNDLGTKRRWREVFGADPDTVKIVGPDLFILADSTNGKGSKDCPDARWISAQVAAHADATNIFLFFHVPPIDPATLERSCDRLQALLAADTRIRAVFNGHVHQLDGVVMDGSLPYLFDGHIGSSNGVDYRGFRVVEVGADGTLHTWTTDGTRRFNEVTLPPRG